MQQYFWQCPLVECPPVSDACETVEFLVYTFQYRLPSGQHPDHDHDQSSGGQAAVSVQCQSCPYCLDRSPRTPQRSRPRSRSSQQNNRRRRSAVTDGELGQQVRPFISSVAFAIVQIQNRVLENQSFW